MLPREHPANPIADSPQAEILAATSSILLPDADDVIQAEARAKSARARAMRLRQEADAASSDVGEREPVSAPSRRWRLRRPGRRGLAFAGALVVVCASLTASGYIVWHHRNVAEERQRAAEFSTAGRNAVVTMMSIDPSKARDDLQRFADQTTGVFKIGVLLGAEDLVKTVEQSKVSTKCAVQATAVESMTKDSAVVLVAAKSESTKPDQAKPESRSLRVVVSLQREGGQLKVSRIEMAP